MVTAEVRPLIPEADKLISKNPGNLLIRARNLSVVYKRRLSFFNRDPFAALTDVSVDVFSGESLGIIGRNGVGKTTLLRVLSEIISVDNGWLKIMAPQPQCYRCKPGLTHWLLEEQIFC